MDANARKLSALPLKYGPAKSGGKGSGIDLLNRIRRELGTSASSQVMSLMMELQVIVPLFPFILSLSGLFPLWME